MNGTMGKVISTDPLRVDVEGHAYEVGREVWESIVYTFDEKARKLAKTVKGEFEQVPLKLAAAITIHKCLSGDTLVSTDRGLISIREIKEGDSVVTADGSMRNVIASASVGKRNTLTIHTKGRREIRCTPEHRVLVIRNNIQGWVEAQRLITGDLLTTQKRSAADCDISVVLPEVVYGSRSKVITAPSRMTEDFAWWLGVMIGDGSYSDQTEGDFWLTTSSIEVRDRFIKITKSFGVNIAIRKNPRPNRHDLYFVSHPLRKWLAGIGLGYDRAPTKTVPPAVFQSSLSIRASLLRGLWDSDGSVRKGMLIFTTTSKLLVNAMHVMLDSLGIEARKMAPQLTSYTKDGKKIFTGNTSYQLRISAHAEPRFMELVGFTRLDRAQAWAAKNWTQEKCDKSSLVPWTDEVVCVDNNGEVSDVYDLEVDTNHNFFANGLLVSNSQGMSLDNVVVDLGFGAFAAGQTYVSLSRARTLQGMVLRRAVQMSDLITSTEVIKFMSGETIAKPTPAQPMLMEE